jgi:putative membrane protein
MRRKVTLRTFFLAVWPPLPVWRRLDLAVVVVAVYTVVAVLVYLLSGVDIPDWGGASAVLNALILGVLLSFRNAQAYDRWWEGRKLWGQLINDSRNVCLKVKTLPGLTADDRRHLGRLVTGFAVALKNHLRGVGKLQTVPGFEADPETPANPPLYLAERVYEATRRWRAAGKVTDFDLLLLDPHAKGLMDVAGACERIKSSPVPLSYRSLLRHGLVLYLLSTPWLIADQLEWLAIPVMALLAYFLLGIDFTAEDVEEPFGRDGDDLALSAYCDVIRRAAEEVLGT